MQLYQFSTSSSSSLVSMYLTLLGIHEKMSRSSALGVYSHGPGFEMHAAVVTPMKSQFNKRNGKREFDFFVVNEKYQLGFT